MPVLRASKKSKNGPEPHRIGADIDHVEQIELAGLVEQTGDCRNAEAEKP